MTSTVSIITCAESTHRCFVRRFDLRCLGAGGARVVWWEGSARRQMPAMKPFGQRRWNQLLARVWLLMCSLQLSDGSIDSIFDLSETRTFPTVGLHRVADKGLMLRQGRVGALGDFDSDM